jgi:hypothetical protein
MTAIRNWLSDNQALAIFLIGQAIVGGIYMVNLAARVSTLEVRGSPHLERIDARLTVLESMTDSNKERIDRLVDKATK